MPSIFSRRKKKGGPRGSSILRKYCVKTGEFPIVGRSTSAKWIFTGREERRGRGPGYQEQEKNTSPGQREDGLQKEEKGTEFYRTKREKSAATHDATRRRTLNDESKTSFYKPRGRRNGSSKETSNVAPCPLQQLPEKEGSKARASAASFELLLREKKRRGKGR